MAQIDFKTAFRDVLTATGVPAKWLNSEEEADALVAQQAEQAAMQQQLALIQQGASAAKDLGAADQAMAA